MPAKKLVNANKEGQDRRAAMLTDVGSIVEVRYNESKKSIEFYNDNGFLGSTNSKERIEGYAQVKKIENLLRGYHFTLDFYEDVSKEELLEKEQNDLIEISKKKEEIKQAIEKEKEEIRQIQEARLKADVLNSSLFQELVERYYARDTSLISGVFTFFESLLTSKPLPKKEESPETWWRDQLQKVRDTHFRADYLYQLNETGELLPIVKEYHERKVNEYRERQEARNRQVSQQISHQHQGRSTHCWRCGSTLTSDSHSKCLSCKWLICSCGACKKGCSSTH